jgi:RimK family alpha-L-glutamate ligase
MDKTLKILIVVGGGTKHLASFVEAGEKLGLNLTVASFSDIEYKLEEHRVEFRIRGKKLDEFGVCYIRLAGKRYEDVALLVNELKKNKVKIIDRIYEKGAYLRLPLPKSIETKVLHENGIPVPKTYFGTLRNIAEKAPEIFGFPFVIKSTIGKQGHAVWSPEEKAELDSLIDELSKKAVQGDRFIAQEFIEASQRDRVFVIGDAAIAGITRPTRWRKRFIKAVNGEVPAGIRKVLSPLPNDEVELAVKAAKSLSIDIAGVDILKDDKTGKLYVLEVNSAPRWVALKKDTGINIEEEILKFLSVVRRFGT